MFTHITLTYCQSLFATSFMYPNLQNFIFWLIPLQVIFESLRQNSNAFSAAWISERILIFLRADYCVSIIFAYISISYASTWNCSGSWNTELLNIRLRHFLMFLGLQYTNKCLPLAGQNIFVRLILFWLGKLELVIGYSRGDVCYGNIPRNWCKENKRDNISDKLSTIFPNDGFLIKPWG